jgi:protein SCO1
MKKIYLICSIIIIIGIAAGVSFFMVRDASAKIPPDITLITQNKEPYRFGDDNKKLKLVEFIYTHCPDICPTTTQKMNKLKADLQKKDVFGKKVEFLTITIDPYRDTPEELRNYMNSFEIEDDGNWTFLTGDKNNIKEELKKIEEVANAFKFQYRDPGNGFFIHSTFTFLVDENNKFVAKFPMGEDFNKEEVAKSIINELN